MPNNTTDFVNTSSSTTKQCLFYWVNLDQNLVPIPGTMRAKNNNQYDAQEGPCNEARLTPYQIVAPIGKVQCFPKNGLRYFYQFNNITKQIVPNSLISRKGKPNQMCVGTNTWLEYKLFSAPPVNNITA